MSVKHIPVEAPHGRMLVEVVGGAGSQARAGVGKVRTRQSSNGEEHVLPAHDTEEPHLWGTDKTPANWKDGSCLVGAPPTLPTLISLLPGQGVRRPRKIRHK